MAYMCVLATRAADELNWALSILEKLHVPDGWCSSGLRANEYTQIESLAPPVAAAALEAKPP